MIPMAWKVLVTAPYMQPVIERFQPIFLQHDVEIILPPVEERFEEEDLLQWISEVDGVICGDDRFTERVLRAAPKLKVLSKWGTGIDSIDQQACKKLGIAVRNTPDAFSQPVADSIMGYILCFARNLLWMDQAMRKGVWQKIPGRSLGECVLGVIGVGNVGKALVRRAVAHGMHVLGNDLVEMPEDFLEETSIEMTSKEEVLEQSDFVSLNCDLNPTSYHLMNEVTFAQMRDKAIIINTARGPVIKEEALIRALQHGGIAGAALDVFEEEPLPDYSPLRKMDNVLLAPHNANSSPEAWERVHQTTIHNLLEELEKSS
jgi:D-3-phosphoglycerate dehydrogenase